MGKSGSVSFGLGPDLRFGSDSWTVAFWVKSTTRENAVKQVLGNRVGTGGGFKAPIAHWQIWNASNGNRYINYVSTGQPDGARISKAQSTHDGEWVFIAVVIDQAAGVVTYYKGRQGDPSSLVSPTASFPSGDFDRDGTDTVLGGQRNDQYDELAFWKRALSSSDIEGLFNLNKGFKLSFLLALPPNA